MDQLLSALQFLVQQRTYLIAAAALVAIVFVLRVMGAAGEIELKYIMPLYLVGGFSALVLAIQAVPAVRAFLEQRERGAGEPCDIVAPASGFPDLHESAGPSKLHDGQLCHPSRDDTARPSRIE